MTLPYESATSGERALREALAAPEPEPVAQKPRMTVLEAVLRANPLAMPPAAPAPAAPVPDGMVMVPRKELGDGISLLHQAMVGACDCLTKTHEAKYHAESCFYRRLSEQCDKLEAAIAASPAAPVVREPVIDEMDAVASKYAHKMALDLECVLSDYSGKWWDAAMQTLGEYRSAMNAIHERESPTHMGEPVLPQHGITGGGNG